MVSRRALLPGMPWVLMLVWLEKRKMKDAQGAQCGWFAGPSPLRCPLPTAPLPASFTTPHLLCGAPRQCADLISAGVLQRVMHVLAGGLGTDAAGAAPIEVTPEKDDPTIKLPPCEAAVVCACACVARCALTRHCATAVHALCLHARWAGTALWVRGLRGWGM